LPAASFASLTAGVVGSSLGCAPAERPARIEDQARAMAPVPACIVPLPGKPKGPGGGAMKSLTEDQYWQLVFPGYDTTNHKLASNALACTGFKVFDDPIFQGGTTRGGSDIQVQDGDVGYGSGGDGVRIVWLKTHRWPDGTEAGPLALVRTKQDFEEVYAVGAYKRTSGQVLFQAERMGTEVLITATDDGCQGQAKTAPCEKNITILVPRFGQLKRAVTFPAERRAFATGGEAAVMGQVAYQLNASPQYTADGITLYEQIQALDSVGRVVHKTELSRTLVLHDGAIEGSDSLWGKVFPGVTSQQGSAAPAASSAPTPASSAPSGKPAKPPKKH
jgi:hypothetical protein